MIHIRVSQLLAQCTVQNMYTKQHVEIRLKFLRVFYWHLNNWLGGGGTTNHSNETRIRPSTNSTRFKL